jgi:hypothetical protein
MRLFIFKVVWNDSLFNAQFLGLAGKLGETSTDFEVPCRKSARNMGVIHDVCRWSISPRLAHILAPSVSHCVKVRATRFPSEVTLLTFGGIASFLTFPVFPRAKRMDWYPTFSPQARRNGTIERSSYHERTHHDTRHAIQRTGRSGHVVGADASRARNRRAILALDGADQWSPSCHTRRCCLA